MEILWKVLTCQKISKVPVDLVSFVVVFFFFFLAPILEREKNNTEKSEKHENGLCDKKNGEKDNCFSFPDFFSAFSATRRRRHQQGLGMVM